VNIFRRAAKWSVCLLLAAAAGFPAASGAALAEETKLRDVHVYDTMWYGEPGFPVELIRSPHDFIILTEERINGSDYRGFIERAGTEFTLHAPGYGDVYARISGGFSNATADGFGLKINDITTMKPGVAYSITAPRLSEEYRYVIDSNVKVMMYQEGEDGPAAGVPWIEAGINHVSQSDTSFRTYVDRSKLPAAMRDFSRIRVMHADYDLGIRKEGGIERFTDHSWPYNDVGAGSAVPGPGTWYILTILYDADQKPLGYREDMVTVGGGTPSQPPPSEPRNPMDYGSDIDPSYNAPAKQLFTDVGSDYWAYSAIADLSTRGVLGGYPDGKFRPDRVVTRAELAKIMVLAAGLDVQKVAQTSFADVKPGDWHAPYVEAAKFYLNGYSLPNGSVIFDPDAPALREDLAVAIVKLKGYDSTHFPDLSVIQAMFTDYTGISSYARNYVAIAVEAKLVSGFPDDTFRAQQPVNRAQAAAMLSRAYQFGSDTKLEQQTDRVKVEFPMTPVPVPVPVPAPTVTEQVYAP